LDKFGFIGAHELITVHRHSHLKSSTLLDFRLHASQYFSETADPDWRIASGQRNHILDASTYGHICRRQEAYARRADIPRFFIAIHSSVAQLNNLQGKFQPVPVRPSLFHDLNCNKQSLLNQWVVVPKSSHLIDGNNAISVTTIFAPEFILHEQFHHFLPAGSPQTDHLFKGFGNHRSFHASRIHPAHGVHRHEKREVADFKGKIF
jgi:hypothetical protein